MLGFDPRDLAALWLTLRLALSTSVLLLLLATPLAYWLSRSKSRWALIVESLVALPLVLPPTVLGFYLLYFSGPTGALGKLLMALGLQTLPFTFTGILVGSLVYSLPFAVQPLHNAFAALGPRVHEAAATLRASPVDSFFAVSVPLSRHAFLSAFVLSFAHTLGEFGVVLMMGGSIQGQTETASIAIFRHVETLHYDGAHRLSITLLASCFVLLLITYGWTRRGLRVLS